MASLKRFVHLQFRTAWSPLAQQAPDIQFTLPPTAEGNGDAAPTIMALTFIDPDQEMHIYVMDDTGRKSLIELLTGGIVLPK